MIKKCERSGYTNTEGGDVEPVDKPPRDGYAHHDVYKMPYGGNGKGAVERMTEFCEGIDTNREEYDKVSPQQDRTH